MIQQKHTCLRRKQIQGFSLPGAIFIMVVLAGIGVAMVNLSSTSSSTSALNILQSRAYYSAYSGTEWAIANIVTNDNNYASNNNSCIGVDGQSFNIDNFNITVSCNSNCSSPTSCCHNIVDCQLSPRVSEVTVTATSGNLGDIYRVSRTIQVTVSYDGS